MIDFHLFIDALPELLKGASLSLSISVVSCLIGLICGSLLGMAYFGSFRPFRLFATIYVSLFRGTPMLVQIMFFFYLLPEFGFNLSGFWCAVIAIGLNSTAYISQIVRTGIKAISRDQIEAAKALGMNSRQIKRHIIFPQVIKIILPALGNELVTLVKDSSMASIIGVMELSKQGAIIRSRTYDGLTIFFAVSAIYFVMTTSFTLILNLMDKERISHVKT